MKKLLAIIFTICVLATALCISAFAAENTETPPAEGVVLRISVLTGNDDKKEVIEDYTNFEDGWNAAMKLANKNAYNRVVVDLYADWTADSDGDFTDDLFNGSGFYNDTIYFNDDVRMTLNMNGHTINRGLDETMDDGEVIYIDTYADVIINNGTIKGGKSANGASGIHINSGANVTLNNVNLTGNHTVEDHGGAIALYNGASLTMNGGSLTDNKIESVYFANCYGGAIYASESNVTLNNVTIKNNVTVGRHSNGAAICADESTVLLNGCTITENGKEDEEKEIYAAVSIIYAYDNSTLTIQNSTLSGNGEFYYSGGAVGSGDISTVISMLDSTLIMEKNNKFTANITPHLIQTEGDSEFYISDTTFTANTSIVLYSDEHKNDSFFNNCTFANNGSAYISKEHSFASHTFINYNTVSFYDCDMGNSTYAHEKTIRFIDRKLEAGIALTVSGLKGNGTIVKIKDYHSLETGWAEAMDLSDDEEAYKAVVIDFHTDWVATDGKFTDTFINGIGFDNDTLCIPSASNLIINLNGNSINRALSADKFNGEVIYISSDANVTINGGKYGDPITMYGKGDGSVQFGSITGGWSANGGGGLHITSGAKVTLNNVDLSGNKDTDDDGAGAAVRGAKLIVNGGRISDNMVELDDPGFEKMFGGGIFADESEISLNSVLIQGNHGGNLTNEHGSAIAAKESTVAIDKCEIRDNGTNRSDAISVLYFSECAVSVTDTLFTNNGYPYRVTDQGNRNWPRQKDYTRVVFQLEESELNMTGCVFDKNDALYLIKVTDTRIYLKSNDFTDDCALTLVGSVKANAENKIIDCQFSQGLSREGYTYAINLGQDHDVEFVECDLSGIKVNSKTQQTASIFGEGSVAMIVALLALIASGVCIFLTVYYNKKKAAPVATDSTPSPDSEE